MLYVTQSREVRYVSNEVSIEVAALMAGVSYETFLSWMHHAGGILVMPDTADPRCGRRVSGGVPMHVRSCGCQFVASPHPDVVGRDPLAVAFGAGTVVVDAPGRFTATEFTADDGTAFGSLYRTADSCDGDPEFRLITDWLGSRPWIETGYDEVDDPTMVDGYSEHYVFQLAGDRA
ncbi:hypothetical protein AWC09_03640 [Mycolicibacter hiberniae]|nr:hypothetical protein AWC09_03640 [Mycolicibacter hiberniae]